MNKKTDITKVKYQSTFLPLISKAETRIKELIIQSALLLKSKAFLRLQIRGIIRAVNEKMPKDVIDRQAYIDGLYFSSERMIKKYYDRMVLSFIIVSALLLHKKVISKKPKTQIELIKIIQNKKKDIRNRVSKIDRIDYTVVVEEAEKYQIDTVFEAKGTPNVFEYPKKLEEAIGGLAKTEFAPAEEGKQKITVWQKAELDVRHEAQEEMINKLVADGVLYAWISSHPDCSKRCSKWQGKLVSLTQRATNPQKSVDGKKYNYDRKSFVVGKIDKHTVYSLPDIMDVIVLPYGYKNNIISGFNCRHKLVPYQKGSVAPTEYDAEEVKKNREINAKLRAYEREIRRLKRLSIFNKTTDKKLSKMYLDKAKALIEEYKAFAEKHGFAWLPYRLEV